MVDDKELLFDLHNNLKSLYTKLLENRAKIALTKPIIESVIETVRMAVEGTNPESRKLNVRDKIKSIILSSKLVYEMIPEYTNILFKDYKEASKINGTYSFDKTVEDYCRDIEPKILEAKKRKY